MEPPRGIEPRTYALRASPVDDGDRWLVSSNAGLSPTVGGLVTAGDGQGGRWGVSIPRRPTVTAEYLGQSSCESLRSVPTTCVDPVRW